MKQSQIPIMLPMGKIAEWAWVVRLTAGTLDHGQEWSPMGSKRPLVLGGQMRIWKQGACLSKAWHSNCERQMYAIGITFINEECLKDERKNWGFIGANKWKSDEEGWRENLMGFMMEDSLILDYVRAEWSFVVNHFPEYKEWGDFLTIEPKGSDEICQCHSLIF